MAERFNCPNCGAPISADKCPYCGTVIYDFAALELNRVNFIKLRIGDKVVMFKAVLEHLEVEYGESETYYDDNDPVVIGYGPPAVHMDFQIVKEIDGIYAKTIRLKRRRADNG